MKKRGRFVFAIILISILIISLYFVIGNVLSLKIVKSTQRISNTTGNFIANIDNDDAFGGSITSVGDLNGDGIIDLVVGTAGDDDGGTDRGAIYVLFMHTNGTVNTSQKISNNTGNFLEELNDSDQLGIDLASIGDLNGDNITDIAVGATTDDDGNNSNANSNRGAIYVLFMHTNGTVNTSQKISDTQGNFLEELNESDNFGSSVDSVGDLNGDGITDLVVGAVGDDDGGTNRGAVYVLFMHTNGTVNTSQKISNTTGNFIADVDNFDDFGFSVTSMGDLNGDGITDISVGVPFDDDGGDARGAVYVLFMHTNGTVNTSQKISDTQGNFLEELNNSDSFGYSVASIGDLDGDGIIDIISSAYFDDDGDNSNANANRGAVYVLFMHTNGTVKSSQKISNATGNFKEPLITNDFFGVSSASIGDLDGDGTTDIAVGTIGDDGGTDRGAAYVLFMYEGDVTAPVATYTCSPSDLNVGEVVTCTCSGTDAGVGLNNSQTSSPTVITTTETGTFTVSDECSVEDLVGNTATATGTYNVLQGGSPGAGGSGSGLGSGTTFTRITPGAVAIVKNFDKSSGVKEIQIEVNNEAQDVKVTVIKYDSKPAGVSVAKTGKVYKYLEIKVENIGDNLNKATVEIQVEKSWVSENELERDDITMSKFDEINEEWNDIETIFTGEDDEFYFYETELDSFSFFTIGQRTALVDGEETSEKEREQTQQTILILVITIVSVIIISLLLVKFFGKKKRKKHKKKP